MKCTYTINGRTLTEKEAKRYIAENLQQYVKNGILNIPGLGEYYSISSPTQQNVIDKLTKLNDLVQPNNSETYLVEGREVRRVTSVIKSKSKKKFGQAYDKVTLDIWEEARATGEKIHSYNQDIVNKLSNRPSVVDVSKLSPNEKLVYDNLASYINDLIGLKIKGGSVFFAETRIADVNKNLAGTVDLLEVTPDGKINIYDYKTRSKENLNKIKLDEYSQQLKNYADIIESVIGTDVLQRRIVPIKITRLPNNRLSIDIKDQEPVALEKTGIEELDTLLDKLNSRLEYLESQTVPESQKLSQSNKIENVRNSIKAIQKNRDISTIIDIALEDVEIIINDLNNGTFDNLNLRESHDILKLYKEFDNYLIEGQTDEDTRKKIGDLITQARAADRRLKKAEEEYLVRNGEKYGIIGTEGTKNRKDFLSPVKELGKWDRWVQGPSFSEHPIIQTLRRAVEGQLNKTRDKFVEIRDTAKEKQKAMFDYLGESTFEPLLQINDKGERTGKLVDKISPSYWREVASAKARADINWFKENSDFNSERYKKDLDRYIEFVGKSTKLDKTAKQNLVQKWVKENSTNWYKYHLAKDKWYDPKWMEITNGKYKGTPVEDFYNYYRSTMHDLMEDLPLDTAYETFIPNLKAGFLERAANAGLGNTLKGGFDFSSLEVLHEDPKYGKYDADNNPIDNIPLLYTESLNPDEKSYDLGLLLTAFAGTSLNYKNLTDLESLKEASLSFVRNQEELITTSTGEVKQTQSGQDRKKANETTSSHYGQLKDYVDVVFYGRSRAMEKTKTFKSKYLDRVTSWAKGEETVTEREYAWSKLFDGVLNFTAIKALGFNLFAPVTNYLSSEASSFMTGANGLYFSAADKTKALALLAANDEKTKLFVDKFKVKMGDFELDELSVLSTDKIKMGIQDMAFVGYHLGDYAVQNSNFIAMLLSGKHSIKWDDYDVVDGKLKHKTSENELDVIKFKNKVMKVNKKIIGNMDKNDYAAIKRYALGRAIMQFRNWLPAMFESRWGRKKFDYDLEEWSEGRYRVGFRYLIENIVKPIFTDTKSKLLAWKSLTEQERAALKSNIMDLVIIGGTVTLLGALRGDGDDEKTIMDRYSIRVMDRLLAELTFFTLLPLPNVIQDKYQIIISPAAAVSTVEDVMRVWDHTVKKINAEERADPARAVKRLVPGINQIIKLDEVLSGKVQY